MPHAVRPAIATIVIAAACAFSIARLTPPGADDPQDGFDTTRALEHLRVIAREPHPIGSPANERVRQYLVDQFSRLGLEVRSPEQSVSIRRGGRTMDYTVRNVLARLRGTNQSPAAGQAVLLAAHYDSVPEGPGAGDDGAAVAALLEVARVLSSGEKFKRDVIFLITDGEEEALLGARAFVTSDDWRGEPGVVFNFEARGASGSSIMFETSRGNAWLVAQYAAVAPHPVTTSVAVEVYRRMPNDTDFTIFRQAAIPGLNFAFIGSDEHYHQPTDDLEHLDVRSMRHHGRQALALARRCASLEALAPESKVSDAVYFDLLGCFVVRYPQWLSLPIAFLTAALWVTALVGAWKAGKLRWGGLIIGIVACLIAAVIAAALCLLLTRGFPDARERGHTQVVLHGMIAISIIVPIVAFIVVRRWINSSMLVLAGAFTWLVLTGISLMHAPGGAYTATIPALMLSIGAGLLHCGSVRVSEAAWWVIGIVILLVLVPLTFVASQALTLALAPALMLLPALGAWTLGPLFVPERASANTQATASSPAGSS